jgi:hypothetical protein
MEASYEITYILEAGVKSNIGNTEVALLKEFFGIGKSLMHKINREVDSEMLLEIS